MREVQTCPICNSSNFEKVLKCKDYTVSGEEFQIQRCTACKFLITNPAPEIQDLPAYYQSDQYISHTSRASSILDRIYLLVRSYTRKWKLGIVTKTLTSTTQKSILDYGCGTGEFLQTCKSAGWRIRGVEPSLSARSKAENNCKQQIATSIGDIQDTDFQIITLWHVLEHVPELNTIINTLHKKLNANGQLIIAVPNPSSWDSTHYKEYWAAYDLPRHLWHFTPRNMELLLSEHNFSLQKTIPMKLDAFYVCLLSEKYRRKGKTTILGIINALVNAMRSNLNAKKSGEYSSIIYIAKK